MTELLAPGGSCEALKAAINAGADAVYMGGIRFGARAYAQNPEENDLLYAMDYCHLRERKLPLTGNRIAFYSGLYYKETTRGRDKA